MKSASVAVFALLSFLAYVPLPAAHPGPKDPMGCHEGPAGDDFHCHPEEEEATPPRRLDSSDLDAEQEEAVQESDADDSSDADASVEEAARRQVGESVTSAEEAARSETADEDYWTDTSTKENEEVEGAEGEAGPDALGLVRADEQETVEIQKDELTALRARVDALEAAGPRFDKGRAGVWFGVSLGAVALSSLVTVGLAPPGQDGVGMYALSSALGGLMTSSIFSLQMGHRSPTAVAGGILVLGNIVAPIVATVVTRD